MSTVCSIKLKTKEAGQTWEIEPRGIIITLEFFHCSEAEKRKECLQNIMAQFTAWNIKCYKIIEFYFTLKTKSPSLFRWFLITARLVLKSEIPLLNFILYEIIKEQFLLFSTFCLNKTEYKDLPPLLQLQWGSNYTLYLLSNKRMNKIEWLSSLLSYATQLT